MKRRERYLKRHKALESQRQTWKASWQELADFVSPRSVRFKSDDKNKGDKRHSKIINGSATLALRTLRSGMMAGITSPARPWFRLGLDDPDLQEFGPVRQYLDEVQRRMQIIFARSNLYQALPIIYGQLGLHATGCMMLQEHPQNLLHFSTFQIGEYSLANGEDGRVNVFYREYARTVQQLVEEFGIEAVSPRVRRHYEKGELDQFIDVVHAIQPNAHFKMGSQRAKHLAFSSVHFETTGDGDQFLRESGFNEFPIFAPRWERSSADAYGTGPGWDAIGDIKALQLLEREKAEAIQKQTKPPMVGPASLQGKRKTLRPGETTYVDMSTDPQGGFRPAFEVKPDINGMLLDIQEHQRRISRYFYEDLFLMLANTDRRQITAREVEERHEEKLLMLGPMLENLENELLDPIIDRTYTMMDRAGFLPDPPPEIEGQEINIEYISILAQAQRAVETSRIELVGGFVGQLAQFNPDVLDKFNMDAAVDEYAEGLGAPIKLIRTDDEITEIRAARAQQQQAAMAAEQAGQMAQTAQTLSQTPLEDGTALERIFGNAGAAAAGAIPDV